MVQLRRVVVLQGYLLVQAWEFGMLVRGPLYQILKAKKHLIKMVGWDQVASDFRLCKWPPPLNSLVDEDLARYFDELNSKEFPSVFSAEQDKCQVITFSHFLPRYVVLGGVYTWSPGTIQLSGHSHVCLLTFPLFSGEQNECSAAVEFFDKYQRPPSLIMKFLSFLHKNRSFLFVICMQV